MQPLVPPSLYNLALKSAGCDARRSSRIADQRDYAAFSYVQQVLGRIPTNQACSHKFDMRPWIASAQEDKNAAKPLSEVSLESANYLLPPPHVVAGIAIRRQKQHKNVLTSGCNALARFEV